MYEEFFGLQRRPFSAAPDAAWFVPWEGAQAALDALAIGCERGQAISVLTGDAGVGKTLIGLRLAFELQPTFATVFLNHSAFATRRALLQAVLFELHRPFTRLAEQELRLEIATTLQAFLPDRHALVLILDEAHRLSESLLDEVRLLTLHVHNGEPFVRVVLIGNRELEERLADPALADFNQRIGGQVELPTLTQSESLDYLRNCLEMAGGRADEVFTDEALSLIAKAADGVPHCLNQLSDHSLLRAYASEQRPVSVELVREALDDLKQLPLQWHDPGSSGEIYRGLSQSHSPTIEDSAVDLWPKKSATESDHQSTADAWPTTEFGDSGAAIEIGADDGAHASNVPSSDWHVDNLPHENITCLKDDWQPEPIRKPVNEVLEGVSELTATVEARSTARHGDESAHHSNIGQVFAARDLEFGAPASHSFAVEEFAESDSEDLQTIGAAPDDEWSDEIRQVDADDGEVSRWQGKPQPLTSVWNLPSSPWESCGDDEFEEEPVIDRYVRIETGIDAGAGGSVWNCNVPHAHGMATTRMPVLVAQSQSDSSTNDDETSDSCEHADDNSGIVESYSRSGRGFSHVSDAATNRSPVHADDLTPPPLPQRDWQLPRELLDATLSDDGIEEQIGTEVLELYLETQQLLQDRSAHLVPPPVPASPPESRYDVVQPERILADDHSTFADNSIGDRDSAIEPIRDSLPQNETERSTRPDTIQRAYGRLFSELRRRHR